MQSDLHLELLGKGLWEANTEKVLGREVCVALNHRQKEQGVQNLTRRKVHFWLLLAVCFVTLGKLPRLSEPCTRQGFAQWRWTFLCGEPVGSTAFPFQPWLQKLHECELTARPGITARSQCCLGELIKLRERREDHFFLHTASC